MITCTLSLEVCRLLGCICLLLGLIHFEDSFTSTSRVNTSFMRALVFPLATASSYLTDRSPYLTPSTYCHMPPDSSKLTKPTILPFCWKCPMLSIEWSRLMNTYVANLSCSSWMNDLNLPIFHHVLAV